MAFTASSSHTLYIKKKQHTTSLVENNIYIYNNLLQSIRKNYNLINNNNKNKFIIKKKINLKKK